MESATKSARTDRLIHVQNGVAVLDPAVGADTQAVLGAMASRAPDLVMKIDRTFAEIASEGEDQHWTYANPPRRVTEFLEKNLAGYNHASIASMAKAIWVFLYGFGWPVAWLLEDFPLFDGQEVSTRAVDGEEIPGGHGPGTMCRFAPAMLADLHERWMDVYREAKQGAGRRGYAYDRARAFLPGTIATGVVITQDVRAVSRHLDYLRALGGAFAEVADMGYAGLSALAPVTTASVGGRNRLPHGHWRVPTVVSDSLPRDAKPGDAITIRPWDRGEAAVWRDLLGRATPRARASTYLDPVWRHAPRFLVSIDCSVAVARDFHRHRPLMPWTLQVVVAEDGAFQLAPWYDMEAVVPAGLLHEARCAFQDLRGEAPDAERSILALHALPFGALVRIEAVATLPDLLYMLELRYAAGGANPEYRAQARAGLEQLCALVPDEVVRAEHMDGLLLADDPEMPES